MAQDTSKVQFIENHLPPLQSGGYKIAVSQELTINQQHQETYQQTRAFYIASERFTLPLQSIHSVFPPDSSLGEYGTVLPHIVLTRSTLPWERNAGGDSKVPWLALILFHEDDRIDELEKLDLQTARSQPNMQFSDRFPPEPQEAEETISIIKIPVERVSSLIPTKEELKLLAHVRQTSETIQQGLKNTELAVIIGNRIPQPGRNIVHLISLENYFKSDSTQLKSANPYQYFVSLKSWEFQCKEGNSSDRFKDLLINLNKNNSEANTLRRFQQKAHGDAERYLSQGYVPIKHNLRNGEKTISWYRSPLLPGQNQATIPSETFPIHAADQLLRYFTEIDMLDVSYAAAYQLGQLLALQDKKLASSLCRWKQQQVRSQRHKISENLSVIFNQKQIELSETEDDSIPEEIRTWFNEAWLLRTVPFNYLVPDLALLPEESIRFFWLDNQWLESFICGACGLTSSFSFQDLQNLKNGKQEIVTQGHSNRIITGFFLRSVVISEFPALKIQGFDQQQNSLSLARVDQLSDTVLLCLFEGEVSSVEVSMGAEILHFGMAASSVVSSKTSSSQHEAKIMLNNCAWKSQTQKIINITESLKQLKLGHLDASSFAFLMVESSPKIVFKRFV